MAINIEAHLAQFGRVTPVRRQVAQLLQQAGHLSAYEIIAKIGDVKAPSVYRALEFLVKAGIVHKVARAKRYAFCPYFTEPHTPQFWHCGQCECIRELPLPVIKTQHPDFAHAHEQEQIAEVTGCCKDCVS